ncbi:MAG TPA: hypothetical protein VM537_22865 [Anaerolineae bacterium]|nr:hypothetical protein [Anaerolineae bacterium]
MRDSLRAEDVLGIGPGFRKLRCPCGKTLVWTRRLSGEMQTYCRACRSETVWLLKEGYEPEVVRSAVRAKKVPDVS